MLTNNSPENILHTAYEGKRLYNLCEPLIKPTLKIIEDHSNQIESISKRNDL